MRFDLAIFDLDGTLLDSATDLASAVQRTLTEAGLAAPTPAQVRTMVGDGVTKLIERALPGGGQGVDVAALVDRFRFHYGRHLCDETRLYDGIPALLAQLRAAGMTMAVLTNKPAEAARRLVELLGIAPFFAAVMGDGDGFPRKPDPAAARELIARQATSPDRTVVIGDGIPDLRMAHALGCSSVAALWGYATPAALAAERPSHVAPTSQDVAGFLLA